jgi:hypothetical protein
MKPFNYLKTLKIRAMKVCSSGEEALPWLFIFIGEGFMLPKRRGEK